MWAMCGALPSDPHGHSSHPQRRSDRGSDMSTSSQSSSTHPRGGAGTAEPPYLEGWVPGRGWRWLRRLTQSLALVTLVVGPVLGGWQRLDRNTLSAWDGRGWDLPAWVMGWLPTSGGAPARAYALNRFLGGGSAADYLGISAVDPAGGLIAIVSTDVSGTLLLAWSLPLLLALLGGRIFCGWFCPFGVLARALESLQRRLPLPHYRLPQHRSLRFVLLAAAVVSGVLGFQLLLYVLLPHLLIQQSIYGMWLLGGTSTALGAFAGLLLAGIFFGPTTYCATLCPTGAALALVGRKRVFRVFQEASSSCGRHCDLCDRACWLSLTPSTGDPGPDCDLCARCFDVCPKFNLKLGPGLSRAQVRPSSSGHAGAGMVVGLLFALLCWAPHELQARDLASSKPQLQLEAWRAVEGVQVGVSVVDLSDVQLDADDEKTVGGTEISIYLARGPRGTPDARGRLPERDVYRAALVLTIQDEEGTRLETLSWKKANSPRSVGAPAVYRTHLERTLPPESVLEVAAIPGWTAQPIRWTVPGSSVTPRGSTVVLFLLAGFLIAAGLLSWALTMGAAEDGAGAAEA